MSVVKVAIVVKKKEDIEVYYRLFKLMLSGKIVEAQLKADTATIKTEKFKLIFIVGGKTMIGSRHHYAINMYQDEEYDNEIVIPSSYYHRVLKDDPEWVELFEDVKPMKAETTPDGKPIVKWYDKDKAIDAGVWGFGLIDS